MELLIAALGLVLTAVIGVAAYRQNRPSRALAEHEIASQPSMRITVNETDSNHQVWVLPWRKGRTYMLDLEIQVRNTGTKTLEDVFIVLEISSSLYPSEGLRKVDGAARLLKVEHVADPIDGKEMTRVTYRVDSIHPQVTMVMKDFLLLRNSSRIRSDVPVTTKDGGRGKVRWEAIIGYELVVTVMARDIPAIRRDLQLFSFDLNDPLVADVSQAENALARLRELGSTGTPVSATLFVLRRPEYPAKGVPVELERLVARCRLDKAERWDVSYFSELGYLPITVTSYR